MTNWTRPLAGAALTLAIMVAVPAASARVVDPDTPSATPAYQPAKAEAEMFSHLRRATPVELTYASRATSELRYDPHADDHTLDAYVATSDFRTVYTDHPMVILVRPGVRWLGGPLGQISVALQDIRYEHDERAQTDPNIKDAQDWARKFLFADVIYDPFCRLYNLGYATRSACQSTPAQRRAVTARQQHLQDFSFDALWRYVDNHPIRIDSIIGGLGLTHVWTTPSRANTALVAPPRDLSLGKQLVVSVSDPLTEFCRPDLVQNPMLGPEVLKTYHLS